MCTLDQFQSNILLQNISKALARIDYNDLVIYAHFIE